MKKLSFTLLILFAFFANITAQEQILTETQNDLYWHPDRKIEFSDYQDPLNESCIKFNEQFGTQTSSSIGFRWIVDIPRRWRGRNAGKIDKGYIVPVFCKNCSCILSKDSLGLKVDQLLFDMTEVFARNVRRDLANMQKEMNVRNLNSMWFTTFRNHWDREKRAFFGQILRDIYIDNKENAYENWRETINETLELSKEFATTAEDRLRFVLGKPIVEGYIEAKTIMGDMRPNRETNE